MKSKLLLLFLFACSTLSYAQFKSASYMIDGYTLPYQIMYPEDYDETKQYPLVVFLHGAGERGNDNQKQLTHGKDFLIDNFQSKYPAIVIAPQCPENTFWSNVERNAVKGNSSFVFDTSDKATPAMETLVYLTKNWINSGHIDKKQIYVGGLSMGGMGTYELLWRIPNTFAAAFPICGGGDIKKVVKNSKKTALWIFHGSADNVVPPQLSQNMFSALQKANRNVRYSEYEGVTHGSWHNVFKETELVSWLFKHQR